MKFHNYSFLPLPSTISPAMASPSKQDSLQSLIDLAASQKLLVSQYLAILSPTDSNPPSTLPPNPPNPLHVLRDSATLLKAHTTKLSLLLINKPFTPSAVTKVLRDVSGTCLPAMMTAVQICQPDVWGSFLRQRVVARVRAVMREVDVCLAEVNQIATEELSKSGKAKAKASDDKGRDSLTSTGVVWEACDALIALETLGFSGLAARSLDESKDMIKDAIEELKEWEEGDGEDDDEDGDGPAGSDDEDDDKDSIEDMFSAANSLPKNRPDLKKQLNTAIDKLRKIVMLYAALSKRRLKTFTPTVATTKKNIATLDSLLRLVNEIPTTVDDLANAFYELDSDEVDQITTKCISDATKAVELVKLNWDGQEDEFTTWANKWIDVMK